MIKGRLKPDFLGFRRPFCLLPHYLNAHGHFRYCCDFSSLSVISLYRPCSNTKGTFNMDMFLVYTQVIFDLLKREGKFK